VFHFYQPLKFTLIYYLIPVFYHNKPDLAQTVGLGSRGFYIKSYEISRIHNINPLVNQSVKQTLKTTRRPAA
jgi:hypothetical protein